MHDRVTVLYGHNMADGSMFADLYKFTNTDFSMTMSIFTSTDLSTNLPTV